jgi:hypothetical protein
MAVSLAARLEVSHAIEAIEAWRTWTLTGRRDGSNLRLRPVARRRPVWRPMLPVEAVCKLARMHEAPNPDCTCGVHGVRDLTTLRRTRNPAVLGRVALWGRVIEHELGFRARFGYPQRLRLICPICFWRHGPERSAPNVVGMYAHGEMMPLCLEHLGVAERHDRGPLDVIDLHRVEQGLLATYAVDLLAL